MQILGVKVDQVNIKESVQRVEGWLGGLGKHYVTTPNLEIIKTAQTDPKLKDILNKADLAIPDSSRLGWLKVLSEERNPFKRLLFFPAGFLPKLFHLTQFDTVTGVDLMDSLCKSSSEKGFTIGLLGGGQKVAENTAECLQKKYIGLKINFVNSKTQVNCDGESEELNIPKLDILFVAFGGGKQEKWIANNLDKIPVKVAMGVGGSFDYLSGNVPRAPRWLRVIGFEWLFRLIMQPWRIKRQIGLIKFLLGLMF